MSYACSVFFLKKMKIMLEMTNYAKNYANTIYQSLMRKLREKADERKKGERRVSPIPTPSPNKPQALEVFFNAHFSLRHSLHNWRFMSQARHRFIRALMTAGYRNTRENFQIISLNDD